MAEARPLVARQAGSRPIEVRMSDEDAERYLPLIVGDRIESHRDGFRQECECRQWRALLHPYHDPMPVVNFYGRSIL